MKTVRGIVLPESDTHFGPMIEAGPLFKGKGTYQLRKLVQAMAFVRQFRVAVDVGAHVGLWSRVLAAKFHMVCAFEPVKELHDCALQNLDGVTCFIQIRQCALGAWDAKISMSVVAGNTGNAHFDDEGELLVAMRQLDSFQFKDVDFLKIDVEGYELRVIEGAEATIKANRPVIVVEQKPGNAQRYGFGEIDAVNLLRGWGYKVEWCIGGDYCLTCR